MRAKTFLRTAVVVVLALAAGATVLAQRRFGFPGYRPSWGPNAPYDGRFVFVRMSYPTRGGWEPLWSHDYPTGEQHFLKILTAVSNVRADLEMTSIMGFDDPEMFKFPVIYLVEPGPWWLSDDEAAALRAYLTKGGFLIVDDFPFTAWPNFELQMSRVFPDAEWHDLDVTHPMFHTFFDVRELPTYPPYPKLGDVPIFRALFEGNDPTKRMLVIANYQNDLSEYWEHSDQGTSPVAETNEAYKIGVNEFIYGMTR